jgi:uncharacterized cupredoxin-like copper-binding protein
VTIRAVLVTLCALLVLGCGSSRTTSQGTPVAPADGSLTVEAFEWGFDPGAIVLEAGEPVTVQFENTGDVLHNFAVQDLDAEVLEPEGGPLFVEARGGARDTLVFTPLEPGEYQFYCDIPGHRARGMEGSLRVE